MRQQLSVQNLVWESAMLIAKAARLAGGDDAANIAKLPVLLRPAVGLRNGGIFRPLPSFLAKLRARIF
jgi:hypothetical protein